MSTAPLPEFIFGRLSTPEGRLERVRQARLGLQHGHIFPPDPLPEEAITIQVRVGTELVLRSLTLTYTTDGTDPWEKSAQSLPLLPCQLEWDTLTWGYRETWQGVLPPQPLGTHVQYIIQGQKLTGEVVPCPYAEEEDSTPQVYGFYVDRQEIPLWFRDAIIYQIFVDRFAPTPGTNFLKPATRSDFYGGTLAGIISQLDYLVDLGVNCLWLTPIFPSPSHHGYDPIAYDRLEERLGTTADWEELVTQAEQRGLRLILDFVANHCSNEHPAFLAAQTDLHSPYVNWFRFRTWPEDYDCFFAVPTQPELDTDHPEVRAYLINMACQWLERGAAGFRLDYAHGVSQAFWSAFRAATRAVKPDSVMFGEITSTPEVLANYTGRMDGCLDFRLLELLRGFFAFRSLAVADFVGNLEQHLRYFAPKNLVLPSFLDNHDMNRFLWLVEGDHRPLKLAALCQFTLPFPPIIYYGTEVGLSQIAPVGPLEESRLPMLPREEQDLELREFYRNLCRFRRQNPTIWQDRENLILDEARCIYGYRVGNYQVVLNNSPELVFLDESPTPLILSTATANSSQSLQAFSGIIKKMPEKN
jgi:glycosidase